MRRYRAFIKDDRKPRMTAISTSYNNLNTLLGTRKRDIVHIGTTVVALRGNRNEVPVTILLGYDAASGNYTDLPLTTADVKTMCPSWFNEGGEA